MLDAVTLDIGPDAVVLASAEPLAVASTAVVNGGFTPTARAIINLHGGIRAPTRQLSRRGQHAHPARPECKYQSAWCISLCSQSDS